MRKPFWLLCLFTFTFSFVLHENLRAQVFREFSSREAFLKELEEQLVGRSVGDAKKDNKELYEKFVLMWTEQASFTPAQQDRIYATSNLLLKEKLHVIPEVQDYIIAVIDFVESGQPPASFADWHRTVDAVIDLRQNRKEFSPYMAFSSALFTRNIIHQSPSVEWKSDNGTYRFDMEDGQPKLIVPQLQLTAQAKGSEIVIQRTGGVYYPLEGYWKGKEGLVTWERAGLDPNKVYGVLKGYEIKMKFSNYEADSVTFFNTDYFDQPLMGKLEDKVLANVTPENASFPQFKSYSQRLRIENIDENVSYEGGFTQRGARFIASGSSDDPAYLMFYRDDTIFLKVSSISFGITEERIAATDAGVVFYLHQDSIIHPGLNFKFFRKDRVVNLFRENEGLQKSPYYNSYHKIDMYSELVTWHIDQPEVLFTIIPNSTDNRALFESDYYFRANRFDQWMGLSMVHPMVEIKNCFVSQGADLLYDTDIARCMGASKTDAMVTLLNFTNMGLVRYNPQTGKVVPTERLFHYIAAKSENEDYDVLQIASEISTKENARLDLVDQVYTLTINGISNITLSDSHNVVLFPKDGTITMKKNRDFDFSGVIRAGRFQFYGSNYQFLYDNFKIEMPLVDSVRIAVAMEKTTAGGRQRLRPVKTVIEEVNGTLEIDRPDNKSGLESLAEYPIFTSHDSSYAYYDRRTIQNNAYHKENFYFELDPFQFDSLDKFENEGLKFKGTFTSADIFPEFRETLTLQEDYSLGFKRPTPQDGYDIYRGKGRYYNEIRLSHEGLRGGGKLKYLTSTTKSEDFLFLPEEMQTVASNFVIEEQMGDPQYPPVTGEEVGQKWSPYEDNLHVESLKDSITFYDGHSKFTGGIDLKPTGLKGAGLFTFEKAELESDQFNFLFSDFNSDTADFRLKSDATAFEGFQFKTNNVKANVDFKTRKGDFISNDGTSKMEFPVNQYIAYMDKFTWFMDEEAIELSGGKSQKTTAAGELSFEGSRFISIHPEQDSLDFYSPAARYDLRENIIDAKKVEFIQVADALVYPDSGKVRVLKKAKMETLTDSRIIANSVTKYHIIDSATIDIFAKRDYFATGLYNYKDRTGKAQVIRFNTVGVDSSSQTYAKGDISAQRQFKLSPEFDFKGKVRLNASQKALTFSGSTRLLHECEPGIERSWFQFEADVDPDEIYIPIGDVVLDDEEDVLGKAVLLDVDTNSIYSAFFSPIRNKTDRVLASATGYLMYEPSVEEYRISTAEKLTQFSLPGNYLSLKSKECRVYGEGDLSFGVNLGQVDLQTVGNIVHDLKSGSVNYDAMLLLNFFFADNAIESMAKVLAENAQGEPLNFDRGTYQKGLRQLVGSDEADKLLSQITLSGSFKRFPSQLEKTMFLTDVQLKWNPETQSYQSEGRIGVGNVLKRQVNIKMDGKVEIARTRTGDELTIYLEADQNTWYFFQFSRNIMQAFSSDEEFNKVITELKSDKRKLKTERGEAPYSFMLSSKRKRDDFLNGR